MLKYCLINSGFALSRDLATGVEQWVGALGGELVEPEALNTPAACAQYDIIHVVCSQETDDLVTAIRRHLGWGSETMLLLSLSSVLDGPGKPVEPARLLVACAQADVLIASDHVTALYVEGVTGRPIHVLAHPADLRHQSDRNNGRDAKVDRIAFVMPRDRFEHLNHQFIRLPASAAGTTLYGRPVDVISGDIRNDAALIVRLSQYAFVCFDDALEGHDAELIYLTKQGCAIVGGGRAEVNKRCFWLSAHLCFAEMLKTLHWLLSDEQAKQFMLECAADKLEYYNHENSRDRLINVLAANGFPKAPKLVAFPAAADRVGRVVYLDKIHHVSGVAHCSYKHDEFVVVCLVRNGMEFLPSFLRHYRAIGAQHFYFIDNESTDGTRGMLADQSDVTVYSTALEHKKFESEIRRVIIERHCRSRWCMCVDIDELFEYPGVGVLTSRGFLGYLNTNGFTAVVAYMLDMFAADGCADSAYLEDTYTHYDISNVTRGDYFAGFEAFCDRNVMCEHDIGNYYGGVRQQHVRSGETQFLLTKHPLIFIDRHIEAVTMPHFCNSARVADVSCLLKHYKLTASLRGRIEEGIRTDTFSFIIKDQIAAYVNLLSSGPSSATSNSAQVYQNVELLVDNGFLHTSARYRRHLAMTSQSTRRLLQTER